MQSNFDQVQEQIMQLQRQCEMLQEKMLRKEMENNAKGSYEGCPQTHFGIDEHVESIVTTSMGKQVNI